MGTPDRPTFSFLCSAYQTEQYLAATIESVLVQTNPDWELVVVDNGMNDVIAGIVDRYATTDDRIRLLRQENQRVAGGVNAAAAAASGRYLVPVHSDDQVLPVFCARMAELLEPRPHIDALSSDAELYADEAGYVSRQTHLDTLGFDWRPTADEPWGHRELFRGAYLHYSAAIRREAWFAVGGFRPGVDQVEDIDLWLRLLEAGYTVRMTSDVLSWYRVRDDSISKADDQVDQFENAREALLLGAARRSGSAEDRRQLDLTLRRHRYHNALRRARTAFRARDVTSARVEARKAFRQLRTVRSALVLVGLWTAPGLLRHVHRGRAVLSTAAGRAYARIRARQ